MTINKVQPCPDEITLSWLKRTADANAITLDALIHLIIKKDNKRSYIAYINDSGIDYASVFEVLGVENWHEFFLEHSHYPFMALFLSPIRQTLLLDKEFCGGASLVKAHSRNTSYICPECEKEQSYIRRSHNLPGVVVCYKHKCSLVSDGKPLVDEVTDEQIRYAMLCNKLLNERYDTDSYELFKENHVNTIKGVNSLIAYPDQLSHISKKRIPLQIDSEEYEVLYRSNNLCDVIHKLCGTRFLMNPFGLNNGYTCPTCRMDEESLYKERVKARTGYKLIDFNNHRLTILHEPCGEKFTTTIARFYEGRTCKCQNALTIPRIRKEISKQAEFELMEPIKGNHSLKLKHKTCGTIFRTSSVKFLESPHCPSCDPEAVTKEEAIRTLDDYCLTYIDGFTTSRRRLSLKCPKGHTFNREYGYLVRENPDCPICKRFASNQKKIKRKTVSHKERIRRIAEREMYQKENK